MFLDEARLAAGIHHPNVGEIFEVGEDDGMFFMVGELILGKDLRKLARRANNRGVAIPHCLFAEILSKVCLGLHEAHELTDMSGAPLNLIHRDISTRNILISYKGYVKLIDFGVAWAHGRLSHTAVGSTKGKIGFMSPEQLRGEKLDRRADIFALGVVLYMITTNDHPFPGQSEGERLTKILTGDFIHPQKNNPDIDDEMTAIILKALAHDVNQRYATAAEMGDALTLYAKKHGVARGAADLAELMDKLFKKDLERHNQRIREHRKLMGEQPGVIPLPNESFEGPSSPSYKYSNPPHGRTSGAPRSSSGPRRSIRGALRDGDLEIGGTDAFELFGLAFRKLIARKEKDHPTNRTRRHRGDCRADLAPDVPGDKSRPRWGQTHAD